MLFTSYKEFIGENLINENVQQAKLFLVKRALAQKKESPKSKNDDSVELTPEEKRKAENDPNFLKIKNLLNDNPGYVFAFTKFFFEENVPFEELEEVYGKIKEYRSVLSSLPMSVDRYALVVPDKTDSRSGFERLGDDLEKLKNQRIVKKWVDNLYGDIKREYQNSSDTIKEKVLGISIAFDELGKESNGTKDEKVNKTLQDLFFDKLKRYKNLNEVIQAALSYIKAANNSQISKFLQTIQKVNEKYGLLNGAEVVYDEDKVLILEVKSFQANKELNSNTSHCIASSSYHWDSYVGADTNYNKQYYIYNFNLAPNDDKSIIGITIEPGGRIRACHTKSDRSFSDNIKQYLRGLNISFDVLAPMTPEEIEKKKKRVIANKEIIKPNLSLSNAKKFIEEGADPNAQQGKPLINAVAEDEYEKTQYLLDQGASPNIGGAIKGAKNIKMIRLLVSYGATVTNEVFSSVCNDYEGVKYLIDAGMDTNFDDGFPLRHAAKNNRLDVMKLLVDSGAKLQNRRYMVIKWAAEWGRIEILKYLLEKLDEHVKQGKISSTEIPVDKSYADWISWSKTSDKIDEKQKKEVYDILAPKIKDQSILSKLQ